MNKSEKKPASLASISSKVLKLLPLELRCEIDENDQREDLSFMEKAAKQELLHDILKQYFREGRKPKNSERCHDIGTLRSIGIDRLDSLIGKLTRESDETVRRRRKIYQAVVSNPQKYKDLVKRIDGGSTSIDYAARMIENEERKLKPSPTLPDGEHDLIYIDPPWKYDLELSGAPDYKTMTLEELEKIKIPAHKNCVMFCWTTNPKLDEALELLKAWHFRYVTNIVWVKQKDNKLQQGTGYYLRGAHELLLIAVKGKLGIPAECDRPPSVVFAPRGKHSEKPEIFYEIIERMYPNVGSKLEMFARKKRNTGNWAGWGDEL